jgi:hypothetical protein
LRRTVRLNGFQALHSGYPDVRVGKALHRSLNPCVSVSIRGQKNFGKRATDAHRSDPDISNPV